MFLLYGTQDLHLAASALGTIFATASVGGLIGAVVSRARPRRRRHYSAE